MSRIDDFSVPDEYPARPSIVVKTELLKHSSVQEKKKVRVTILLSLIYFVFGIGVSLYGPFYPLKADILTVPSYIYGINLSCSYLVALLFYPVATKVVTSISCKLSIFLGAFIIGYCKVLLGTLDLIHKEYQFILLSFGIQIVEGFGISILLVSTFIILFSDETRKSKNNSVWIMCFTLLGISIGPIAGEVLYKAFGFSVPFYGTGVITLLVGFLLLALILEPGQRITYKDIPVISWTKQSKMFAYFFIIFVTFNYVGIFAVILEPYLQQFHLDKVYLGVLFSVPSLACGLSSPGWWWITKKGVNSLLLACIASILIIGSLILIVPAAFTALDISLVNASVALLLQGLGCGGKLTCVAYAANKDLKTRRSINGPPEPQPLLIPTVFTFGAFFGYFTGSFISGFIFYHYGIEKTSCFQYALESLSVIVAVIFAFKRNYRAPRRTYTIEETQPILQNR